MLKLLSFFAASYAIVWYLTSQYIGPQGIAGDFLAEHPYIILSIYLCMIGHVTITAMSLSFHRYHTHKGVVINKWIDMPMQIWLWMITSMSKVDWVAVHIYHHAHSDQKKDPHSPLQKGLVHALLFGVFDYTKAKSWPEVEKIKKTIPTNKIEAFIHNNSFVGPFILTVITIVLFGPLWGGLVSVLNFLVSPLFAIGGVNALAHWWGYRNHVTNDNSRNIGFLFPLNFITCGELDHNNHHAHMKSCSFRHRWFEFDIGFVYLKILNAFKLADLRSVYSPATLKQELSNKISELIEKDYRFKKRCEELAAELNTNYQDLKSRMEAYCRGEKVKLDRSVRIFMAEVVRTYKANQRLKLSYV
ncbi:MAG TPA: fatty acid desaturase [Bacteriovoracaceae bacterium]|nr:fatty acid desaturase [Bacteriovoracaceae bacterium]